MSAMADYEIWLTENNRTDSEESRAEYERTHPILRFPGFPAIRGAGPVITEIPDQESIRYFIAYGLAGYGPSGEDGYAYADTWRNLADTVNQYLRESADEQHEAAHAIASDGDYEEAWTSILRSEELSAKAASFDNARENAPLYRDDPKLWEDTIKRMTGETFPLDVSHNTRLYVWPCEDDETWAEHTAEDDYS